MSADNPYASPAASVQLLSPTIEGARGSHFHLSPSGRFGRVSYLFWLFVYYAAIAVFLTMIVPFLMEFFGIYPTEFQYLEFSGNVNETMLWLGMVVSILGYLVASVIFDIRRLHDLNRSGYWVIAIYLVAGLLINFVDTMSEGPWAIYGVRLPLFLLPGSRGSNRFGAAGKPLSRQYVLGVVMVLLFSLWAMIRNNVIDPGF